MSKGRRVEYKDGMIVQSNREGGCIVQSKQRHCCVGAKETHHKRGRRRKQEEEEEEELCRQHLQNDQIESQMISACSGC